jgi:hypothetical protein
VTIDLHGQLRAWRRERRAPGRGERWLVRAASLALRRPALAGLARAALRPFWPLLGRRGRRNPAEPWLAERELPPLPKQSFRAQWKARSAASPVPPGTQRAPRGLASRERAKDNDG